jgi:mitochondrial chaperone BCS1
MHRVTRMLDLAEQGLNQRYGRLIDLWKEGCRTTLLDTAYSTLVSNQLLVGGVGTLAFGSLMYVLRAVPQTILGLVEKTLWTTVSVENMSNDYRDVDAFIERLRLDFFSRSLEIKDGYLKTGFGGGLGAYDGTLFKYSKTRSSSDS